MFDSQNPENATESPRSRGWHKHIRKSVRSIVPRNKALVQGLGRRATEWLLPWNFHDYPGKGRGLLEAGGIGTLHTAYAMMKGNRRLPANVSRRLADHIERRVLVGVELISELRANADGKKPRRLGQGFTRVDPVTGLDGRSRSGRRKVKEL